MKLNKNNVDSISVLSPMQEGMLFSHLLHEDDSYFIQSIFSIEGDLVESHWKQAWSETMNYFSVLRSSFVWRGVSQPLQIINKHVNFEWDYRDFSEFQKKQLHEKLESYVSARRNKKIHLDVPPLIRFGLIKIAVNSYVFVVEQHHILTDAWCQKLIFEHVSQVYNDLLHNKIIQERHEVTSYADYISWLNRQPRESSMEYWRSYLMDAKETKISNDVKKKGAYRTASIKFGRNDSERIINFVKNQKVSVNTFFQVVWGILIHKRTNLSDIIFGVTVSGRNINLNGAENIVGMLINTLPIRIKIQDDVSVTSLLQKTQIDIANIQKYSNVSLAEIQAMLTKSYQNILFDSIFVSEESRIDFYDIIKDKLRLTYTDSFERTEYPITVITKKADDIEVSICYDDALFSSEDVSNICHQLKVLSLNVLTKESSSVSQLSIFSLEEKKKVLIDWNDTGREYPKNKCIHELFEDQAKSCVDSIALSFEGRDVTYGELNSKSNQLANYLRKLGVKAETLVAVCMERSPEMVLAIIGVLKAGGAYVPLDPNYPDERLKYILNDTKSRILITCKNVENRLKDVANSDVRVVSLDAEWELIAKESENNLNVINRPSNLAYIIYTSGSTGTPKGAMIEHTGVVNLINHMQKACKLTRDSKILQFSSFSFDASVFEFFSALFSGAKLYLFDPKKDLESLFELSDATVALIPPTVLNNLGANKCKLKTLISAGEALLPEVAHDYSAVENFINGYGPTECTVFTSISHIGSNFASIGRPISNMKVYILDKNMDPLPIGVTGEIYIAGIGLARGYLNRPSLTAEKFVANPFDSGSRLYKTGDLGKFLPNGDIEYVGRIDNQIKIRGFRIELGEIECTINACATVRDSRICVRTRNKLDKHLIAYVVPTSTWNLKIAYSFDSQIKERITVFSGKDASAFIQDIRNEISKKLPDYMIPSHFLLLDKIPQNLNGKTDIQLLLTLSSDCCVQSQGYVPPRNETESKLCEIWQDVLGLERVGVHDNFFQIGGHSLLAMRIASRINAALDIKIPIRCLFEFPTISDLLERIDRSQVNDDPILLKNNERAKNVPLSFSQEGLWIIYKLFSQKAMYNIPLARRCKGTINYIALEKAINFVVNKHESLRTNFSELDDGKVYQIISDWKFELTVQEIAENEVESFLKTEAWKPFDLQKDHLIRIKLFKISEDDHVLLIVLHHMIADGWSIPIFFKDLIRSYNYYLREKDILKEEGTVSYADYCIWQQQLLTPEKISKLSAPWKSYLDSVPDCLNLPFDKKRPEQLTYAGKRCSFRISKETYDKLSEFIKKRNITTFIFTFATVACLLYKYTNQTDIVLGTPTSNRKLKETENIIGLFVNTLVLRIKFNKSDTFDDVLQKVKEAVLFGYENQDMPFEHLVQQLNVERALNINPIFQVMVAFIKEEPDYETFNGLHTEKVKIPDISSKFDLTFDITETDSELHGSIEFSSDLFKTSTINALAVHLENLFKMVLESPDIRVGEIDILSLEEKKKVLIDWNDTGREYPKNKCIHELFEDQAKSCVDSIALSFEGRDVTYGELNSKSNQLANYLRKLGVKAETLVAVCMERSPEMVLAIIGVLKAGGAYVPLDPNYPDERLKYILNDTKSRILITCKNVENRLKDVANSDVRVVSLDAEWELIAKESENNLNVINRPSNLAYIIYTSGSTGTPKGVMIEHISVVNLIFACLSVYKNKTLPVLLANANFCFDVSVFDIFYSLLSGGKFVISSDDLTDPHTLIKVIKNNRINTVYLPPHIFSFSFSNICQSLTADSNLQILTGVEPIKKSVFKKVQNEEGVSKVINGYGPTEATVCSSFYEETSAIKCDVVPIGSPIANVKIYILNESLFPVPVGVCGEIYIAGVGLARGYLNRPDSTAGSFIASPFGNGDRLYKTGDFGKYLPNGNIEFLGRIDDQVKIRGYRIELKEIELAINSCNLIRTSVVLAKSGENGNKQLVAYLVPQDDNFGKACMFESQTKEQVSVFSRHDASRVIKTVEREISSVLPSYMVPNFFVVLSDIPLTISGKKDINLLLSLDVGKGVSSNKYVPPRNKVERHLCKIWEKILGISEIGIYDDFFKIGGTSISAIQVVSLAMKRGLHIRVADIFTSKTVEALSRVITANIPHQKKSIVVCLGSRGKKPPLFMIHPGFCGCEVYEKLSRKMQKQYCCYGIDSYNLYSDKIKYNIVDLASYYLSQIKKINNYAPNDELTFLGWSLGGRIALEIAYILEKRGFKRINLILLDTVVADDYIADMLSSIGSDFYLHDIHVRSIMPVMHNEAKIKDMISAEIMMSCKKFRGLLNNTSIELVKAMKIQNSGKQELNALSRYLHTLKYNNIDKCVADIKSIKLVEASSANHWSILDAFQKIYEKEQFPQR